MHAEQVMLRVEGDAGRGARIQFEHLDTVAIDQEVEAGESPQWYSLDDAGNDCGDCFAHSGRQVIGSDDPTIAPGHLGAGGVQLPLPAEHAGTAAVGDKQHRGRPTAATTLEVAVAGGPHGSMPGAHMPAAGARRGLDEPAADMGRGSEAHWRMRYIEGIE